MGTGHHSLDWLKDNRYTLDATQGKDGLVPLEAGAVYEWNVAVVDPYGDPVSEKFYIIDESPPAQFSYCPSDGPTPTDEIIPP